MNPENLSIRPVNELLECIEATKIFGKNKDEIRAKRKKVKMNENPDSKVVRIYRCRENGCDKPYKSKQALQRHHSANHGHDEPKPRCDWCAKEFARSDTLKLHLKVCVVKRQKKKRVAPPPAPSPSPEPMPQPDPQHPWPDMPALD